MIEPQCVVGRMNMVRNNGTAMVIACGYLRGWKAEIVMLDRTDQSSEVRLVPYRTSSMMIGGG